jgi:hypothetical protein
MTEVVYLRRLFGAGEQVRLPLIDTWVRKWWPWIVLAMGALIIALGAILFSPNVRAEVASSQPVGYVHAQAGRPGVGSVVASAQV